jgi:hypothetical protein
MEQEPLTKTAGSTGLGAAKSMAQIPFPRSALQARASNRNRPDCPLPLSYIGITSGASP